MWTNNTHAHIFNLNIILFTRAHVIQLLTHSLTSDQATQYLDRVDDALIFKTLIL